MKVLVINEKFNEKLQDIEKELLRKVQEDAIKSVPEIRRGLYENTEERHFDELEVRVGFLKSVIRESFSQIKSAIEDGPIQ
jgi:hypothetical protein